MNPYKEYLELLDAKRELDDKILKAQIDLYSLNAEAFNKKETGSVTIKDAVHGFKITVTKRINVRVDQTLASVVGIGFKTKYDLDSKVYKELSLEDKKRVDECLTTETGKPAFKVEAL